MNNDATNNSDSASGGIDRKPSEDEIALEKIVQQLHDMPRSTGVRPEFAAELQAKVIAQVDRGSQSRTDTMTALIAPPDEGLQDLPIFLHEHLRPRRPFFPWILAWYRYIIPACIVTIILVSVSSISPFLALAILSLYLLYRFFRRDPWAYWRLGEQPVSLSSSTPAELPLMSYSPGKCMARWWQSLHNSGWFHFANWLLLFIAVVELLAILYDGTSYSINSGIDSLWLLLVLPTFLVIQQSGTRWVIASVTAASIALLGLNLWFDIHQRIGTDTLFASTLWRTIPEIVWLWYLAFLLHVLVRYAMERQANDHLLQEMQNEVLQAWPESLDERSLYAQIVNQIANSFGYEHVLIFRVKVDASLYCTEASGPQRPKLVGFRLKHGLGIVGRVAETGEPIVNNNVRLHGSPFYPHPALIRTSAELAVPIKACGKIHAVLDVQSDIPGIFLASDLLAMKQLADHAGWVLSNIFARRSSERIQHLVETLADDQSMPGDLESILTIIADVAAAELDADLVIVYERDSVTGAIQGPACAGPVYSWDLLLSNQAAPEGLVDRFLKAPEKYYFQDTVTLNTDVVDPLLQPRAPNSADHPPFIEREGIRSRAILRLQDGKDAIGLMFLNFRTLHNFDADEQHTMKLFANLASMLVQKAQVHRRLKEKGENKL